MQLGKTQAAALLLIVGSAAAFAEPGRKEDGHKAYVAACAKCHDHGSQGAPVTNNPKDWADRSDLWEAVLFEHAKKGYIDMPPKGGDQSASDYDVEAAAEYMLTITHPELPED